MNVTYALLSSVILLNNSIKVLLLSFARHIELQKFLNAPHHRELGCYINTGIYTLIYVDILSLS